MNPVEVYAERPLTLRERLHLVRASCLVFRVTLLQLREVPLFDRLRVAWWLFDRRGLLRVVVRGRTAPLERGLP